MRRGGLLLTCLMLLGFDWPGEAARLEQALDAGGDRERVEVVRYLAASKLPAADELLVAALSHPRLAVRRAAAAAVGRARVDAAIPALLPLLKDIDGPLRRASAASLGDLGAHEAGDALARALSDDDVQVRAEAARALGKIGGPRHVTSLLTAFDDPDPVVRSAAAEALRDTSNPRVIAAYVYLARDLVPEVRFTAIDALASRADSASRSALIHALGDPYEPVVLAALRGLLRQGARDAADDVRPLLTVAPRRVRLAAAQTLEGLEASEEPSLSATSTAPWLVWLERTVTSSGPAAAPVLSALEQTLPAALGKAGGPLVEWWTHVAPELRPRLAALLGRTQDMGAAPTLLTAASASDPRLRAAAFLALAELSGPLASAPLLKGMKDTRPAVRRAAAQALSRHGDRRALEALVTALTDEDLSQDARLAWTHAAPGLVARHAQDLGREHREDLRDALSQLARGADERCAVYALRTLGAADLESSARVLASIARNASLRTGRRLAALAALGQLPRGAGAPSLRSALLALAGPESLPLRATAIAALGFAGDAADVSTLTAAGEDGPWPVMPVAAFALSTLALRGVSSARSALCAWSHAREPWTLHNVRVGLALGDSAAAPCPSAPASTRAAEAFARPLPDHAPSWGALVLADGRVLLSYPDSLGERAAFLAPSAMLEPWSVPD